MKPTQSKAFWALALVYSLALGVAYLDVAIWRPKLPKSTPECIKPEPRNAKAIDTYLDGCIKPVN